MKQLGIQHGVHERCLNLAREEKCAIGDECLDVFNRLVLAPHSDALFDGGCISFAVGGTILISAVLSETAQTQVGVSASWGLEGLEPTHVAYLAFYHQHELRCLGQ